MPPAQPSDRPPAADLYAVLGVSPRAGTEEIRAAWRILVKAHHPDVAAADGGEPTVNDDERIRAVNEAWTWLGDAARRRRYDLARLARADIARAGRVEAEAARGGPRSPEPRPDLGGDGNRSANRILLVGAAIVLAIVAVIGLVAINGRDSRQPASTAGATPAPTTVVFATPSPSMAAAGSASPGATSPPPGPTAAPSPPSAPSTAPAMTPLATPFPTPPPTIPATSAPAAARPLQMPNADVPAVCRRADTKALRLDGDVDGDGILDSIFFLGPCANLDAPGGADRTAGPFIYASGRPADGIVTWRLLSGATALSPGWAARSAFVGAVMPAPDGATDLGVELVAPDGTTSALAVYRVDNGQVREIWDSLRDSRAWESATFSYAPKPAGGAETDGALLVVESGPATRRVRQLWQWTTVNGTLELILRDSGPAPTG